MEKPNVVVIGYGFAGRCFHAYLVGLASGLNLYGIATSRPQARDQIQRDLGVKTFRHFDEVLADPAVDLVVLATPNDLHAPHAIQALAAGKHVVTDKPMCLSIAEADQMIAASQAHDRLLSVFQNRRWDGDFLAVKDALAQGLLGDPFLLELFWGQYGPPRGWRSIARHGGGKFFDLGAHLVDQALQLIDAPLTKVYASFHSGDPLGLDVQRAERLCFITRWLCSTLPTASKRVWRPRRWRANPSRAGMYWARKARWSKRALTRRKRP